MPNLSLPPVCVYVYAQAKSLHKMTGNGKIFYSL